MKKLVIITVLVVFAGAVSATWLIWSRFVNEPASSVSEEIIYEVQPGRSFHFVARELKSKGVIKNAELFLIFARVLGQSSKMKKGEYLLNKNMRPSEVLSILTSGKSIERKMTISEGLNIFEIASIFEQTGLAKKEEFLKTVRDSKLSFSLLGEKVESLEGYLYPETYSFTKYTTLESLISQMVKHFLEVYVNVEKVAGNSGLSRHQIVTLASIIEKETGAPEERPLISAVFHNRLKTGMRLQTDPTVLYGMDLESQQIKMNITKADLSRYTPYNTYVIKGLPPGPIANPGEKSLLAAVQPSDSDYLYFVSQNDGTHVFSKDYSGHQKAVQKFQMDPKARQGKSWRDLSKRKGG